ncbi:MAG: type effector Hrp-dependent outer [Sedimentibacter sp.]|jgi:uncharacterized protein YgbK (DUF1537 family)|nr:type effector Hrp-dependent outer [Sedimentibacter sp.]
MSKVIVIADDLTGANATSVLLARKGFKAATFLNLEKYDSSTDLNIVSINTDSRAIKKEEAYERVKNVVDFFKSEDIKLFTKRIDSTMRGNIGAEVSAVLDSQNKKAIAVVVPSFPSSGRVCIGGYLMVHQVPLEKTDVAKDPKTPVLTSRVTDILEEQMNEKIGFVELGKVLKGADSIHDEIIRLSENGIRVIVIDATTNDDIAEIARAVKKTNLNVVSVDPGPFTAVLAEEYLEVPESVMGQKVMFTIGSVSNLTRKQLDEFKLEYPVLIAEVDAINLVYDDTRTSEVERAADKLLGGLSGFEVIGMTTLSESKILNLFNISQELNITEDEVSQRISSGLAEVTLKVLKGSDSLIGGLYTSGGDVTVAVCNALGAAGIEVKDEVLPLAVYGRLMDGKFDNIPIITKGGLIGDEKSLIKCINYLLTKLSNEYHTK